MFATVEQAYDMGALGVGATIYFGSEESRRQIEKYLSLQFSPSDGDVYCIVVLPKE